MRILKILLIVLTVISAIAGIINAVTIEVAMPFVLIFLGLFLLVKAFEVYKLGNKKNALTFVGITVLLYLITAGNVFLR